MFRININMKMIKKILFLIPIIICMISDVQKTYSQEKNIVIGITGKIIDANSKKPVSVTISFYDTKNKKISSSKNNANTGYYSVSGLKPGKPYTMIIESTNNSKEYCDIIIPFVKESIIYTKDFSVK